MSTSNAGSREGSPQRGVSARLEAGRTEGPAMDFKDRRIWSTVVAVVVVLLIIGYMTGWFGGEAPVVPQQ
jgi:hypothetical protein